MSEPAKLTTLLRTAHIRKTEMWDLRLITFDTLKSTHPCASQTSLRNDDARTGHRVYLKLASSVLRASSTCYACRANGEFSLLMSTPSMSNTGCSTAMTSLSSTGCLSVGDSGAEVVDVHCGIPSGCDLKGPLPGHVENIDYTLRALECPIGSVLTQEIFKSVHY